MDGFGSGLFAVADPGKGVGEVGSGIAVVAVLAASVRDAPDATSRRTFSKRQTADLCGWPGLFELHHEPCHPVDTRLNHVEAWHWLRMPHVLARKRKAPRVATRPGRRQAQ